jgi:hypothetical protein
VSGTVITDSDAVSVTEGGEVLCQGAGHVPYPATPGPPPRPVTDG